MNLPYQNARPFLSPGIAFNNNINALDGKRTNYLASNSACGENSGLDTELSCWSRNEGSDTPLRQSLPEPGIVHRVKLDSSPDDPGESTPETMES